MSPTTAKARISNAQRSEATKATVLDAAIQALITYGYHGATSNRIAELSGLTRGAQMHHFGSKAALVVEALLHLHEKRLAALRAADPRYDSIAAFVEAVWRSFDSDLWLAAAELWTAARTDTELRAALIPAERTIGQRMMESIDFSSSGPEVEALSRLTPERLATVYGLIASFMRGLALYEAFDPNPKRARRQREELVALLRASLTEREDTA